MGYDDTYYLAEVLAAGRLTANMVRIQFGGGGLVGWSSSGVADERLVVVFPVVGEARPPAPSQQTDGTYDYADAPTRPEMRSYTVRAWDPTTSQLTVDFVDHRAGFAADWARQAAPGQAVYLTQARGWYDPPAGARWQLLVGDMTALPALGRILEQLPAGQRAYVIAEVIADADRQDLHSYAEVSYRWLTGAGHGLSPSALARAVTDFDWPTGPGYVWFAGEAAESRAVRKFLRRELGWATHRYRSLGYWRRDKQAWDARYEQLGPELEQAYARAVAAGHSSADALELYDDALEQAGL